MSPDEIPRCKGLAFGNHACGLPLGHDGGHRCAACDEMGKP